LSSPFEFLATRWPGILRERVDLLHDGDADRTVELGELFISVGADADAIHRAS